MHNNNESRLRELLAYYGADVGKWPEEVKPLGLETHRHPRLAALIEEERHFERLLLGRRLESPSRDLAGRIITASLARSQTAESAPWVSILAEVRPAALAAMLVLGFAIGFGMVAPVYSAKDAAFAQSFAEDDGAIL